MKNTKQIVLASRPKANVSLDNFRIETANLKTLDKEEVLVKSLYISMDPYIRGGMNDDKSYMTPFGLNKAIVGGAVAVVEESKSMLFKKGDKVLGFLPWSQYAVVEASGLHKIDESLDIPLSYYLGIVGMTGQTAYFGITDICRPQKGETVVISAAAGAVGSTAGQIAKLKGARVVGIAGSDEKLKMLKNELGFDEVINYKKEDINSAIAKACPSGVDCYYDNVGGEITDIVISHFNKYARMAVCGQISLYNLETLALSPNILPLIMAKSILVKGFTIGDYVSRSAEAVKDLTQWIKEGKLNNSETIIEGFDEIPNAFIGLFTGANTGKMVVKI